MKTPRKKAEPAQAGVSDLRQRAEEKAARLPEHPSVVSSEEAQQQFHELQVHQIELELQNEELRRAQAALEESCARYLDLYDFAPVGYATLNEKGVFLEANLTAAVLFGVARGALVGQMLFRFIHKEDQDNYFQCRRQLFNADTPHGCDLRMQKPDGAIFWVHLAATAAQDANGAPVQHVVFSDITEKRAAAEAARLAGEERHRVILQTAMDGLWRSDTEGRLLEVNASYCRMSGYSEQELLAMRIPDLEVTETHHDTAAHIRKIMAQGEDRFESRHRRKDGCIIDVDVSVQYRPDDGGQMVTFLHDITARKQLQQRLRDLAEWQAVADEEERWRISRRIHDTIIQSLSLASMRLGLIATPVDGAEMEAVAGPVLKVRALLDGAIEECRTVMSDLTPPLLYELGLIAALRELAGQMQAKHGVRMVVEDDGREDVMSHPQRGLMFESIRELVMNAMKHAAPGEIRVSASRGDQDMVINVQDNGKGFYAGSGMHTMPNHHGGFGLFSIRQRLEGLGGRLEIVSVPGDGSTATISLPMCARGGAVDSFRN